MNIYFNPLDKRCKSIIGGIKRNTKLTLSVFCQENDIHSSDRLLLVIYSDGELPAYYTMKQASFGWTISLKIHETGLYFYHFLLNGAKIGVGAARTAILKHDAPDYQLTVYDENYTTPDWFKGGIMYQIFPDRFNKVGEYPIGRGKILRQDWGGMPEFRPFNGKVLNNDFFGGNFNGVKAKLDYIKSLGVSVIYFNPIFEAGSNHRYDTGDYMKVDPLLGTEEDFTSLVSAAKEKDIGIVLDGVFNHTGDDSRYFNKYGNYHEIGAYQSTESIYYDWYSFSNYPQAYDSWWGIDTLPAVNERSESYQRFIFGEDGVIKKWLKDGIMGYRLDVVDELPDFFVRELRTAAKTENPDAIIIGEVWEDASNKVAYDVRRKYLQGKELDSVMNYPLKDAIINFVLTNDVRQLREAVNMLVDNYPKPTLDCLMNILGTHDTSRILTVFGGKICYSKDQMSVTCLSENEKRAAKEKLKVAAFLQYTLPGVPCIFYGDENGMEGYGDPFCRRCFDWNNTDEDLLAYYRKLGKMRTGILHGILTDGEYKEVYSAQKFILYKRYNDSGEAYFYVNRSSEVYTVRLEGEYTDVLNGGDIEESLKIQPNSFGAFIRKDK